MTREEIIMQLQDLQNYCVDRANGEETNCFHWSGIALQHVIRNLENPNDNVDGCWFCEENEKMISRYADIRIDRGVPFVGNALTVFATEKRCPEHSDCCAKDLKVGVNFKINFCPICGKKLTKSIRD